MTVQRYRALKHTPAVSHRVGMADRQSSFVCWHWWRGDLATARNAIVCGEIICSAWQVRTIFRVSLLTWKTTVILSWWKEYSSCCFLRPGPSPTPHPQTFILSSVKPRIEEIWEGLVLSEGLHDISTEFVKMMLLGVSHRWSFRNCASKRFLCFMHTYCRRFTLWLLMWRSPWQFCSNAPFKCCCCFVCVCVFLFLCLNTQVHTTGWDFACAAVFLHLHEYMLVQHLLLVRQLLTSFRT